MENLISATSFFSKKILLHWLELTVCSAAAFGCPACPRTPSLRWNWTWWPAHVSPPRQTSSIDSHNGIWKYGWSYISTRWPQRAHKSPSTWQQVGLPFLGVMASATQSFQWTRWESTSYNFFQELFDGRNYRELCCLKTRKVGQVRIVSVL
jgi:hypothetical protein